MNNIINVKHTTGAYDVIVTDTYSDVGNYISNIANDNIIVVTDKKVYDLYAKNIYAGFEINKSILIIDADEINKNINTVTHIYDELIRLECNRKTTLVAIGGGVVGDIVAFVASTYMRGIKFVNIPTTTLSQVDSSVGGKTGYDYKGYKNIIGTFYQPSLVYVNTIVSCEIEQAKFVDGIVEIIKIAIVYDRELYEYIKLNIDNINKRDSNTIQYLIMQAIVLKKDIVEKDERENGIRAILNFGHSFGHSIEKINNFQISHGSAVAIGMMLSLKLSTKLGITENSLCKEILDVFNELNLLSVHNIEVGGLFENMKMDKKNDSKNYNIIMIEKIGKAIIRKTTIDELNMIQKDVFEIANYL